jgi:hypothetical protein
VEDNLMADNFDDVLNDWFKRVDNKKKEIEDGFDKGLKLAAFFCEGEAKNTANANFAQQPPINDYGEDMWKHTSLLVTSIGSSMDPEKAHTAIVFDTAPYSIYLEYGSGAYAINGDGRQGGWVFTSNTGIPVFTMGTHPKPYMYPSVFNNKDKIRDILNGEIAKVVK